MARAKHSGKRRNRVQFKWTKELIFFLIGFVVLIGLMIFCLIPTSKQSFHKKWVSTSANLKLDNQFEETNFDKLKKKIDNKETVYVYYAFDGDDTSKSNLEILDHYTNKQVGSNEYKHYNIDKIYVYDANDADYVKNHNDDEKAASALDSKAEYFNSLKSADIKKDIDLSTYCQLWIFKDGQLVFSSSDIISDSQASKQDANFTLATRKFCGYELTEQDLTK